MPFTVTVSGASARFVEGEARADGPDAVPAQDVERLPETRDPVVEDVVVGETGDLERDRGEPGDVARAAP